MAGMFYSIREVAEKLGKSEDEVRQLVKAGQLREFRDGPNLLFKVDEVAGLMGDTGVMAAKKGGEKPAEPKAEEEEEILLAPETPGKPVDSTPDNDIRGQASSPQDEEIELTDADTQIVEEGIKVLGETDAAAAIDTGDETFKGLGETPETPVKEASLEEIEKDVSLDTFGSGSGLLDLSLQADDTSLGGILDEIYTPGGEGKPGGKGKAPPAETESAAGSAMEVAAEADQILSEAQFPEPQAAAAAFAAASAYIEPEPDAMSNAMGIMMFIPLLAVTYTTIVSIAGFSNVMPTVLSVVRNVQGLIWYIAIGLVVASVLITGVGAMMGREKTPKAPKPPKVKKEKPPKPVKEKKGKEAPAPKAEGK